MSTKPSASIPTQISAMAARSQFRELLRRAKEDDERFIVGQRGEPQAVIMGIRDFLETIAPETAVLSQIRAAAVKSGRSEMSIREINREIRASRKERRSGGAKAKRRS